MAIEFGTISRGSGKVYIDVKASVPAGGRLSASSVAKGSKELPAAIVRTEDGSHVLIVPVLRVEQVATVTMRDAFGQIVDAATVRVGAKSSALISKVNTLRKAEGIEQIRNIDGHPLIDEAWVTVNTLIDYDKKTNVAHGTVESYSPKPFPEGSRLVLDVFDNLGNVAVADSAIVLTDKVKEIGGGWMRIVRYSVHVPKRLGSFTVWARFPDTAAASGFMSVEPWLASVMRRNWRDIVNAGATSPRYDEWFTWVQQAPERKLALQRAQGAYEGVGFSVIVAAFDTDPDHAQQLVDSVLAQTYEDFELVIVNASPEKAELSRVFSAAASKDPRVRVVAAEKNLGAAGNIMTGINAATKPYLCFVDHDDFIEPDALFEFARRIDTDPDIDMAYCDEDHYLHDRFVDGRLKPDFDPVTLLSFNYVGHMLCVSRRLLDALAPLPEQGFDGPQLYSLVMAGAARARKVEHVSRVLYHGRTYHPSTFAYVEPKSWNLEAGRVAIQKYLDEKGVSAVVSKDPDANGMYRVEYDRSKLASASIVLVDQTGSDDVAACVASLSDGLAGLDHEFIVVGSGDYAALDGVAVVSADVEANLPAACNLAAKEASKDVLVFIKASSRALNDAWLAELLGSLSFDQVAVAGSKQLYKDGTVRHVGICLPFGDPLFTSHLIPEPAKGCEYRASTAREVSAVAGGCFAVKKADFDAVDGLDVQFAKAASDIDLCLRLREQGRSVVMNPASLFEVRFGTGANEALPDFRAIALDDRELGFELCRESGLFMQRWNRYYGFGDPYYNVNYLPNHCHYEI